MNFLQVSIPVIMVGILVVCPISMLWSLWKRPIKSKLSSYINLFTIITMFPFLFIVGRWDWVSTYLRVPILLLLIPIFFLEYKKIKQSTLKISFDWKERFSIVFSLPLIIFFIVIIVRGYGGYFIDKENIVAKLDFPLKGGNFYVAHGGNSIVINHHRNSGQQGFALDIVKLGTLGNRAKSLFPQANTDFHIFAWPVYSPCSGIVKKVKDGIPDIEPMNFKELKNKKENIAGNHVFIGCSDFDILLAHLKNGTVRVKEGQKIEASTFVGQVGNSGNTTEPHLHFQAQSASDKPSLFDKSIRPIPMLFNEVFLVRNSIISFTR